ncbi:unnamed protein product [Triticum turgidum subsp. durum]|uniref:Uncharacterized protein n=1 Tax=Triticum turgidum subsp. durum TaxID=4567 RepID=A0A9R0YFL9_TRITD|nr:unnamed protein product [Triticum turgidum subsp. durum]
MQEVQFACNFLLLVSDYPLFCVHLLEAYMNLCHLSSSKMPGIAELELKLSEYNKKMSYLQQMVQELASKYDYNPNKDYAETEPKLREHCNRLSEQ